MSLFNCLATKKIRQHRGMIGVEMLPVDEKAIPIQGYRFCNVRHS